MAASDAGRYVSAILLFMATIREYFDTDLKDMALHKPWIFGDPAISKPTEVTARISLDFDANAKYWSFYIPDDVDIGSIVNTIFKMQETHGCVLGPEGDSVGSWAGFSDYSERMYSETLKFTRRIFLYIDALLNVNDRKVITDLGLSSGFYVVVRDNEYAKLKSDIEKPLAFISHDSRDKDELVRELALELSKLMCPVWYDEYSLEVGASLRESIEKGIKETKNCTSHS